MSELSDIRDHAWYIEQANNAADLALNDEDEAEALKYRKIALDVMMLPISRMSTVNDTSISRYVESSGYDTHKRSSHAQIELVRELAGAMSRLGSRNDALLRVSWAEDTFDNGASSSQAISGDIYLQHETARAEQGYTANVNAIGRSTLQATKWQPLHDPLTLMRAHYHARPNAVVVTPEIALPQSYRLYVHGPATERAFTS